MPNFSPPQFSALDATPTRVSTNSAGEPANFGDSSGLVFFPDGTRIAFTSEARNLVAGDSNNASDVFVKNLQTGVVTRVSTNAAGGETGGGTTPVLLPGGDKIAFISAASNLVAGDTNGLPDIFIKDLVTGAITRASTYTDGTQFTVNEYFSTTGISAPDFSPDGTKMAFAFHDGGGATVYIKDLITGTLTVAVPISFAESAHLPGARFSPDGSQLLYRQYNTTTGIFSLFLKDLASGNVTLVSTNAAGVPANSPSEGARFSADGTRIVFSSTADNLVAGDTNHTTDIFVKDLITGAVTLVSVNGAGVQGGYSYGGSFSPDGTKVVFTSSSTNLVPGDHNPFTDAYVKDLLTGEIARISIRTDGNDGFAPNEMAVFSPDGKSVGFYGTGLLEPYMNGYFELYTARLNLPAAYVEGGPAVQIVPVAKALDPGSSNFDLGSLTVAITGGSVAGDQLSLALSSVAGESIAISGNQVFVNNIMVGTIVSSATSLTISFNAGADNPVVELLTEAVRISSTSDNPTAAIRTITFTLVDGEGTEDGVSDTAFFTRKVAFLPVGDDPDQQIFGTPGPDSLAGGTGNDVIDGRGAADSMAGHAGNDIYFVDNAGDAVIEAAGAGRDVVYSSVDYTLGAGQQIEVLSAASHAGTDPLSLTGNALGQEIWGNAGANSLRGGGGSDFLIGQGGNDTYFVDVAAARVYEAAGGGRDVVYASVDYALLAGQSVEVLSASNHAATTPLSLTGNELAQEIWGNAGANSLRGGGGNDSLIGQGGNDTYFVDVANAYVFESGGGGRDVVYASASYALLAGQEIEVLSAASHAATTALDLTGNELGQEIWGNAGVNSLRGGGGNDYLIGQSGNDTYFVDVAAVQVYEAGGGGRDVVYASVSYALLGGQEVEVLSTANHAATSALGMTGNEFAQELWGNAGANMLDGKLGNDVLIGQGGADTFAFTTLGANNVDFIADFVAGTDKIALDDAIFTGLTPGALSASAFVVGTAPQDADDRIIYNSATGQLYFDADGNGAGAAIQFATLNGHPVIAANDFTVI